jgi:flagellar protein FlgJ
MSIPIGSDSIYGASSDYLSQSAKTFKLEDTLNNTKDASDEELMDACKSFESYLLEQVFKGMENTVMKDEDEEQNDYLAQFGDKLYEEYAKDAAESGSLGIAQMLYDSMKRNNDEAQKDM